jgi:hypothetical protein
MLEFLAAEQQRFTSSGMYVALEVLNAKFSNEMRLQACNAP